MGLVKRATVFARFAIGAISISLSEPTDLVFATTTPQPQAFQVFSQSFFVASHLYLKFAICGQNCQKQWAWLEIP